MIYQDTKRFLKRYLQKPSKDYEWSGHDNFKLLDFIQSRYSDEQIHNNVTEIRQAFRDFFEPVGNIFIRFKEEKGVAYKILPYHVKPQNSKHLSKIVDIIRSDRRSIEYPYNGREDQIALMGKIRRHINAEIAETDEAVNRKELVRYAIKIALELDPRDVVVHLKRKYIIKIFKKNSMLSSTAKEPTQKDEEERRFQGYSAEDLSAHYDELINDIDLKSFLDNVMAVLFAGNLDFDEITNSYYEENVLFLVRNAIAQELKQYVSENKDYVLGLAGYIFRHNFESIHERMAVEIFEQFARKSEGAAKFLSYYSGQINIEDGKRYMIPEITTKDGKRWNIASITSITTMWLRSRDERDMLSVKLENVRSDYSDISSRYMVVVEQHKQMIERVDVLLKERDDSENAIAGITKTFKVDMTSKMSKKSEEDLRRLLVGDQQKLIVIKQKIVKFQPIKEKVNSELKELKLKYTDLKAKKQEMEVELRTLDKNLNINSEAFHSILGSLVKALMQRKHLLEN